MTDRSVPITLDKLRHLRFTPNDVADIEEVLNIGLGAILRDSKVTHARAILWGGLKWEDPTLTLISAGDLMQIWLDHGGTLATLYDKCAEALVTAGWFKKEG